MVVYKIIFLILSAIFVNLNSVAANDPEIAGQYGSQMVTNNEHVEHKRPKREDETAQGKVHYFMESFVVRC